MDRGAWWATVHGVGITRSDTIYQPSIHTHTTKVNSVYERKSIDDVYKALGLWCPTRGGGYSPAQTPEAEALLQEQSYLKLRVKVPHQIFFKAIVIDWCQVI